MNDKFALILSGGAARGAFEAGVCYYLANKGLKPDLIVGASVGGINGAFLADKGSFLANALRLKDLWLKTIKRRILPFNKSILFRSLAAESILSNVRIIKLLEKEMKAKNFEDLGIPLHVVATHYDAGTGQVFNTGEIIPPVVASISPPPILPPVKIGRYYYIDGTLNDLSLIGVARGQGAEKILYINLHRNQPIKTQGSLIVHSLNLVNILQNSLGADQVEGVDENVMLMMPPLILENAFFDFKQTAKFLKQGEIYGKWVYQKLLTFLSR